MDFLNINQKALIEILLAGLRNRKTNLLYDDIMDWQVVVKEADRHRIIPLVYYSIMKSPDIKVPDYIKEMLKNKCLFEITEQERNNQAFGEILRKMTDFGISVVILKGLFLRDIYPEPWLRSMCDYDVLVRSEELEKIAAIMKTAGYKKTNKEEKHVEYIHAQYLAIEFHKSLISADRFENSSEFEQKVWMNVIPAKVFGTDVLTLNPTDHAIHLILHMASHIREAGFGLRQLCDWILFIEAYNQKIDWDTFTRYIRSMNLEIFTRVLFKACQKFLYLEIPYRWECNDESMDEVAEKLILDIFDSGVFGNDSNDRITANRIIHYTDGAETSKTLRQKIRTCILLIFPISEKLDTRYKYAKKCRVLLPAAWIHRFVYNMIRRDITVSEKLAVFRPKKTSEIFSSRRMLLYQLGLIK